MTVGTRGENAEVPLVRSALLCRSEWISADMIECSNHREDLLHFQVAWEPRGRWCGARWQVVGPDVVTHLEVSLLKVLVMRYV